MRINKEINSLCSSCYEVYFLGIGKRSDVLHKRDNLHCFFISGSRKSLLTYLRQTLLVIRLLFSKRIDSIHVINEQHMLFFWPLLFFKHTVLDIFDSLFLKLNIKPESLKLLKFIVYAPVNIILVTDDNRKNMMPLFLKDKIMVLPNYTNYSNFIKNQVKVTRPLTIMFYGWLGINRGGRIIQELLKLNNIDFKIIMYGWFSDEETRLLTSDARVDYRGVVSQKEALEVTSLEADYILCIYEPVNDNNINASPNKIYDAIQIQVPLIANSEVKVSKLIEDLNIGYVLNSYKHFDPSSLLFDLILMKDSYTFSEELKNKFSWEAVEGTLLAAHKI